MINPKDHMVKAYEKMLQAQVNGDNQLLSEHFRQFNFWKALYELGIHTVIPVKQKEKIKQEQVTDEVKFEDLDWVRHVLNELEKEDKIVMAERINFLCSLGSV